MSAKQYVTLLRIVNSKGETVEPGEIVTAKDLRAPVEQVLAQGAIKPKTRAKE